MSFESLGLTGPILSALRACGYRAPTPIQLQAIPPALAGRDVLGAAQTGTGKTCAFGAPILQQLAAAPKKGTAIRALILTPTRELAIQIEENLQAYSRGLPLRTAVIFGGVGQNPQVEALRRGVQVLTATPGRLMDLHGQGLLDLSQVEIFVLDEADRMLDMGFIHDVRRIIALLPKKKQTLFFSATMPPEIMELVDQLMVNPVKVAVNPVSSPVEVIQQRVYLIDRKNKTKLLASILRDEEIKNALVFTRTKHGADKVTRELAREGIGAAAIHGNKSQTARQAALGSFKEGGLQVLVATDIAARGLDIEELSHVFNYNLPEVPETYIHRIGRTGRAGHGGTAISFCDFSEQPLLRGIETLMGRSIPRVEGHPYPMEVFEAMKKDARGRIVNEDDEEARAAARERRREQQSARAKGAKEPAAPGARVGAPTAVPKETAKPSRGGDRQRPRKKPELGSLHTLLEKEPEDIVSSTPGNRRNPLDGDVIMDATARLLSTRRAVPPSVLGGRGKRPAGAGEGAPSVPAREETSGRERAGGNRRERRRPDGKATPVAEPVKGEIPVPPQKGKKGKEPRPAVSRSEGRRGGRRMVPPVEGPKSRQKDSTEQPSLMKPFYIEHD
jgi:ATP-dependent RNA helicase RhlE